MSLRALAAAVGVSDGYLSKGLRGKDYKTVSPQVVRRVGEVFGLPPGYFPEEREALVLDRIRSDAKLRDELYRRFCP